MARPLFPALIIASNTCRDARGATDYQLTQTTGRHHVAPSMRSTPRTVKIPVPLLDAVEHLRRPGQPLAAYPSTNAALVGLIAYAVAFPRPHQLTAGLARMPNEDQDAVHDFLLRATVEGIDLREALPKPATAEALLRLAKGG